MDDELRLLLAVATHGPHHWGDVSTLIGKTARQCERHYHFFAHRFNGHPNHVLPPEATEDSDDDAEGVSVPDPGNGARTPLVGYMPFREDMEVEFDDNAEQLIADLVINDTDTDEEKRLKFRLVEIYNQRLKKREEMKHLMIARNLVNPNSLRIGERRATRDEKELIARLQIFSRLLTKEQYDKLYNAVLKEYRVTRDLHRLIQARNTGMKRRAELDVYENVRRARISHVAAMQDSIDDDLPLVSPANTHKRRRVTIQAPPSVPPLLSPSSSSQMPNQLATSSTTDATRHQPNLQKIPSTTTELVPPGQRSQNAVGEQRSVEATLRIRPERKAISTNGSDSHPLKNVSMKVRTNTNIKQVGDPCGANVNRGRPTTPSPNSCTITPLKPCTGENPSAARPSRALGNGKARANLFAENFATQPESVERVEAGNGNVNQPPPSALASKLARTPLHTSSCATPMGNDSNTNSDLNLERCNSNGASFPVRRMRQKKAKSHYPQLVAMPVQGLTNARKLTPSELQVCSMLHITPSEFIMRRDAMLHTAAEQSRSHCCGNRAPSGIETLRCELWNSPLANKHHFNLKADELSHVTEPLRADLATQVNEATNDSEATPAGKCLEKHIQTLRSAPNCSAQHALLPILPLNSINLASHITMASSASVVDVHGNNAQTSSPPVMYSAHRDVGTMTDSDDIDHTALEYIHTLDSAQGSKMTSPTHDTACSKQSTEVVDTGKVDANLLWSKPARDGLENDDTAKQSITLPISPYQMETTRETTSEKKGNVRYRSERPEAGVQYFESDLMIVTDEVDFVKSESTVPLFVSKGTEAPVVVEGLPESQHDQHSAVITGLNVSTHPAVLPDVKEILTPAVTPVLRENADIVEPSESSHALGMANRLMVEVDTKPIGNAMHSTDAIGRHLREALQNANSIATGSNVAVNPDSPNSHNILNGHRDEGRPTISIIGDRHESILGEDSPSIYLNNKNNTKEATKCKDDTTKVRSCEIVVYSSTMPLRPTASMGIIPERIIHGATENKTLTTVSSLPIGLDVNSTLEEPNSVTKSIVLSEGLSLDQPKQFAIDVNAENRTMIPENGEAVDSLPSLVTPVRGKSQRKRTASFAGAVPTIVVEEEIEERPSKRRRRTKRIVESDDDDMDDVEILEISNTTPASGPKKRRNRKPVVIIPLSDDEAATSNVEAHVDSLPKSNAGRGDGDNQGMRIITPAAENGNETAIEKRPSGRRTSRKRKGSEVAKTTTCVKMRASHSTNAGPKRSEQRGATRILPSSEPIFLNLRIKPPANYRSGLRNTRGRSKRGAAVVARGESLRKRTSLRVSKRLNKSDVQHVNAGASSVVINEENEEGRDEVRTHEEEVLAEGRNMDVYIDKPYTATACAGVTVLN